MKQQRICQQCGKSFIGGPRAYFCVECRSERQREQNREFKKRKKSGQVRTLGSTDICERCEKEYTVIASLQRFCPECQRPHTLEHDRATGLEYYHENKEKINPVRYEKRRIGAKKCAWCGKEFEGHNRSITCSQDCRRKRKNALWIINDKKKKGVK